MTIEQQITSVLLEASTINKVKTQFQNGQEKIAFEMHDMTFRLFKATPNNINLEALIQMHISDDGDIELPNGQSGKLQTFISFFKPIGFYTPIKELFSTQVEITIVKEYEETLNYLIKNNKALSSYKINRLSLEENAIIAAFSKETLIQAHKYEDCSFHANGMQLDIFMTYEGYPRVFLDDKYGFKDGFAEYIIRGDNQEITPNGEHRDTFGRLWTMGLLTVNGKDV